MSDEIKVMLIGAGNPDYITPYVPIYYDDTIMDIKEKIAKNISNTSVEQIYLFGKIEKKVNPEIIFEKLIKKAHNNSKLSIPASEINILIKNYNLEMADQSKHMRRSKKHIFYKKFKTLFEWDKKKTVNVSLGHKIFDKTDYPFIVNPFDLFDKDGDGDFDKYLFSHIENNQIIYDENYTLLFEHGNLMNNTIYACTASFLWNKIDGNQKIQRRDDFYRYILQIYFPKLHYDQGIHSFEQMKQYTGEIKISPNMQKIHEIYQKKDTQKQKGNISSINFTLHPSSKIHIPMDILFKVIHSDINMPLIKYNPGKHRENIFRLYTKNYISNDNTKLPYLYVNDNNRYYKIQRIDKALASKHSIGFYISIGNKSINEFYCEFYPNGSINIKIDECLIKVDELINILKEHLNTLLINPINKFIKKSGFSYNLFEDLTTNVEIKYIKYKFIFSNPKKSNFTLNKWAIALKELYVTNNKNYKTRNQIDFQYRKVSSYKVMDAIDKFILNYKRVEMEEDDRELIEMLKENFPKQIKNTEAAVKEIENYNNETRFNLTVYANKKIEAIDNPGFKVLLTKKENDSEIEYENINHCGYLKFIDIYTSFLIKLILAPKTKVRNEILGSFLPIQLKSQPLLEQNENVNIAVQEEKVSEEVLNTGNEPVVEEEEEDENVKFNEDDDEDDYADTDEEEEEEDDWGDNLGGGGKEDDKGINYDSSSSDEEYEIGNLNNIQVRGVNNYFINKIRKYQPELVTKNSQGNSLSFAKSCQTSAGKTPVILTTEEKKKIDKLDADSGVRSYDEFITPEVEGEDEPKYHYICPRFWCFSDPENKASEGRSLSLEQVNKGVCGGWDAVIPKGSKTASNDKRIYQFTDSKSHEGVDGNDLVYKQHYPGFQQKKLKGEDGVKDVCVPCCYRQPSAKYKPEVWEEKHYNKEGDYYESAPKNYKRADDGSLPPSPEDKKDIPIEINGKIKKTKRYKLREIERKYIRKRTEKVSKKRNKILKQCESGSTELDDKKLGEQMVRPIIESFPLKGGVLGYLPMALQKFFNYNSVKEDWVTSKSSKLKAKKWCLLRLGMDESRNNSFLSCIKNIYNYEDALKDDKKDVNIKEGQRFNITDNLISGDEDGYEELERKFNILNRNLKENPFDEWKWKEFLSLNKGNLYHMFKNEKEYTEEEKKVKEDVKDAMKNFIKFIQEEKKTNNEHEIFWDIATAPKKMGGCFFDEGVNLIILKKPKNDIEDKIEVICPKNNFSKHIFDKKRKTIILYMENGWYEPIYMYKRTSVIGARWNVKKMFTSRDFKNEFKTTGFGKMIQLLQKNFEERCNPKRSLRDYDYKENKTLNQLLDVKDEGGYKVPYEIEGYKVIKQLYNIHYQVIAVLLKVNEKQFALPCAPSAINPLLGEGGEYQKEITRAFLSKNETEKLLKEFKLYKDDNHVVVDNECIVGLRTNTNQVVLIQPEGSNCEDPEIKGKMLREYELDRKIMMNYPKQDEERLNVIKKIKLESNFYLMFRNLFKILINKKEKEKTKHNLITRLNAVTKGGKLMTYEERRRVIKEGIIETMQNKINWVDIKIDVNIDDLLTCLDMNEAECGEMRSTCTFEDKSCRLLFPKKNLITGDSTVTNDKIYYEKLVDEIIRYKKVRDYVLKNDTFMNYDVVEYKINDDEIIIISNMFYLIYKNDIDSIDQSEFIKNYRIYDNTNIKDGNIKKYSRQLRIPMDYSDYTDDEEYSDDEEEVEKNVGQVEQKTVAPVKKKEAAKKKEEPVIKKEAPKKIGKGTQDQKKGATMLIIRDYLMKNYKNVTIGELKKLKIIKQWTERWKYFVENIWLDKKAKPIRSGVYDDKAFWNSAKHPLPDDFKSNWEKEENIFNKFNPFENTTNGWYNEYKTDIPDEFKNIGLDLQTIWRWVIQCLLRPMFGKKEYMTDDDTMEIALEKWFTHKDAGCKKKLEKLIV